MTTATPTTPVVETIGLHKRYGPFTAVDHLDLVVPAGVVFGVIGPNGAGKTTTFSMLASLLKPTSGTALVAGVDVTRDPITVRRHVGYMPDVVGVYDDLRVDEYLDFFADSYGIARRARPALIDGLLELVDLGPKREAMVDSLSRGMKQRLSLARALVHDPDLLLLDEPASGLDPRARVELWDLVATLRDLGKTVIVSSHILPELESACGMLAVMSGGRVLAQGTPEELRRTAAGRRRVTVRFVDGTTAEHHVADDLDQARLLRTLQDDGPGVLEFRQVDGDIEALFLALTEAEGAST